MRRSIVIVLIVTCVVACMGGIWATQASMVTPFVLPGATDVVVSTHSLMARRISYHAAGQSYAWRDDISRQLVGQGWRGRDYTFGVTRQFAVTWYTRTIGFGRLIILESAVVGGDPHDPSAVIVEVHRELHFR